MVWKNKKVAGKRFAAGGLYMSANSTEQTNPNPAWAKMWRNPFKELPDDTDILTHRYDNFQKTLFVSHST